MSYCKAEGKVLDVVKSESIHSNCYTNVTIKLTSGDTFSLYKGKLKNKEGEGQKSSSNPYSKFKCDDEFYVFSEESDLPSVGDNISYESNYRNITSLENKNKQIDNVCGTMKGYFFESYPFYNKCNLNGKIQEVHREYEGGLSMDVHLKVKTEEGTYNVKTYEGFYYGYGEGFLGGVEYFSPKSLRGGGVSFFKPGIESNYIIDKDTGKILMEGFDEEIDNCNIGEQKLGDFKFEGGLTNIEVIDLNMKKFREYKGIEEPETTWKEKYEENNFLFGFNYNNFSGGLMISFLMLILFFVAVIKNKYSKQKSIFA